MHTTWNVKKKSQIKSLVVDTICVPRIKFWLIYQYKAQLKIQPLREKKSTLKDHDQSWIHVSSTSQTIHMYGWISNKAYIYQRYYYSIRRQLNQILIIIDENETIWRVKSINKSQGIRVVALSVSRKKVMALDKKKKDGMFTCTCKRPNTLSSVPKKQWLWEHH